MKKEILLSSFQGKRFPLDPRTKLLLTIIVGTISIMGSGGYVMAILKPLLAAIPLVLLIVSQRYSVSALYFGLCAPCLMLEFFLLSHLSGSTALIALTFVVIFARMMPGIMMGYYLVTTTTVSEFIAVMERMRLPRQIVIPLSVMLRFFPAIGEEVAAISDAMKMRGITTKSPLQMLEYRLVPMIICSVKIGEELSAAALTRGLGNPVKRTSICENGFRALDIFVFLASLCGISVFIISQINL